MGVGGGLGVFDRGEGVFAYFTFRFIMIGSTGGATNFKVGGEQFIGRWGVHAVNTLKFDKCGGA